ncbi:MAG: hypothetical protein C4B58_16145 [Deltaproteobacteria bacterium]|nr:MAG: hypothetical protein C4B58_16145 [Deltaproteobacteria bacterium]
MFGRTGCGPCNATEEVTLLLNESYVAIKVDREERPDADCRHVAK